MPALPDTPAGRQLAWYFERIASGGKDASAADYQRLALPQGRGRWGPFGTGDIHEAWRSLAGSIGEFELASVDQAADSTIAVTVETDGGAKRWRVSCEVERDAPHRIVAIDWERQFDFAVTVREARPEDSAALSEVERRCPIVLGERSVSFDRGDDYFAFARLMEDVAVFAGFVDGEAAAINCGAPHDARIGGVACRIMTAIHTRVLPEHQGKGLWGAVSRRFGERYPPGSSDGSHGYVSVDNAAMQHGFRHTPNKWPQRVFRAHLDCTQRAGPPAGRPAAPADAPRIVRLLNGCHDSEEMYLPYTVELLTARLERDPAQYSWEQLWLTDGAVTGVWPQGERISVVIDANDRRTVSRRGLVLDYGFLAGADGQLEALLRAWCARLLERGLDTLSIFTSERSPGYERITGLADEVEAFDMWTPGLAVPARAAERGLYVDPVYF